jgi:hypothetical protein
MALRRDKSVKTRRNSSGGRIQNSREPFQILTSKRSFRYRLGILPFCLSGKCMIRPIQEGRPPAMHRFPLGMNIYRRHQTSKSYTCTLLYPARCCLQNMARLSCYHPDLCIELNPQASLTGSRRVPQTTNHASVSKFQAPSIHRLHWRLGLRGFSNSH